jgi:RNA polymerase sigma factor (sigma-70 family)
MIKIEAMHIVQQDDAELVAESLAGNKEAFRQIVERYQTLVCSLAYCATGSVGQSEDLAQDTFLTAWKDLAALREPAKLRSWLCAIVRFRINNHIRRQGRDPIHVAEPLEVVGSSAAQEASPSAQTITNEEIAILWRSLECIPELYREPLILFYREHQSIETVAANLDLTEDAVKQRLSRGRKMLQEQVLAFVEGALEKTSPGQTFTLGVIAVLPAVATASKAATVGAAVAKGAPAAGVMTVGSVDVLLAVLGSAYISLRAQAEDSKSPRERQFLLQMFGMRMIFILVSFVLFFVAMKLAFFRVPIRFDYLAAALFFYFCFDAVFLSAYQSHRRQQIQIRDNTYVVYSCELIRGMLHGFDRGGTGQMRALGRSRKSAVGCGDNFDAV